MRADIQRLIDEAQDQGHPERVEDPRTVATVAAIVARKKLATDKNRTNLSDFGGDAA
jgi:hypothetical protein